MSKKLKKYRGIRSPSRLIDANLNRCKEGLRVAEDVLRYLFDDKALASTCKELRHKCRIKNHKKLLKSRDIVNDPLKATIKSEKKRNSVEHVLVANFKRVQESSRALEEVMKLSNPKNADKFKRIRYACYELERAVFERWF